MADIFNLCSLLDIVLWPIKLLLQIRVCIFAEEEMYADKKKWNNNKNDFYFDQIWKLNTEINKKVFLLRYNIIYIFCVLTAIQKLC